MCVCVASVCIKLLKHLNNIYCFSMKWSGREEKSMYIYKLSFINCIILLQPCCTNIYTLIYIQTDRHSFEHLKVLVRIFST